MKRALFKLGDYFEIKSKTVTTSFEVKLDVEQWEMKNQIIGIFLF